MKRDTCWELIVVKHVSKTNTKWSNRACRTRTLRGQSWFWYWSWYQGHLWIMTVVMKHNCTFQYSVLYCCCGALSFKYSKWWRTREEAWYEHQITKPIKMLLTRGCCCISWTHKCGENLLWSHFLQLFQFQAVNWPKFMAQSFSAGSKINSHQRVSCWAVYAWNVFSNVSSTSVPIRQCNFKIPNMGRAFEM